MNQGQHFVVDVGYFYCSSHLISEFDLFLTKYKIDLNFIDPISKNTPIERAIQFPNLEAIQLLLKHGASLKDVDCFTHMHWSGPSHELKKRIQLLLDHGANPFQPSKSDQKITSIDKLLKNILSLPNDYDVFKKDMIPYLVGLGAKIT